MILGGFTLVHQFCQVGAHAFTAMGAIINRDVPPYVTVAGSFAEPKGINSEGLRRRGFSRERLAAIKQMHKLLYRQGLTLEAAREAIAGLSVQFPEALADIDAVSAFIAGSKRGLAR